MDHKKIAFRMVVRCVLYIVIYSICVVAVLFLMGRYAWFLPIAPKSQWEAVAMLGLALVVGWIVIVYRFIKKGLWYVQQVAEASNHLIDQADKPILLPEEIKPIQDSMNQAREEALRNKILAKEAEQRKNDLVAYLAHDLRTPLTSIIGYLSLLNEAPDMPIAQRSGYTGIALEKAVRLEGLINEFFEITRFSMTEFTLEPAWTNLSRMMEQMASEFAIDLREKSLSWELDIPQNVEIRCDSGKLARALDNLIKNAIKFSYAGSPITFRLLSGKDRVTIFLSNLGDDIPNNKLQRIFEQFFRLDPARQTSRGGAGLGLAIAKEIIDLHQGEIRAFSQDGITTFRVTLPTAGPAKENPL